MNTTAVKLPQRKRKRPPFARLCRVLTEPKLPLKSNERLVALVMFSYCNMTDFKCWPSIASIRRRARVSRNTVVATICKLKQLGLVTVEKERHKGRFARNVYDFSEVYRRRDQVRSRVPGDHSPRT